MSDIFIPPSSETRRSTYFTFQGLLMSVLILLFLYQHQTAEGWIPRFFFLLTLLGASLIFLRLASLKTLSRWWVQAGLFLGDTVLASLVLYWTQPLSDLYLIYFLIIFGTALTRNLTQSFLVAFSTSFLYLISNWHPGQGLPSDINFWLRLQFLWIITSVLAILSRDSQKVQKEQEQMYSEKLLQVERLATLGQMAGEVAHRIKGPLTTITVNAEVLSQRHRKSKALSRDLLQIRKEVDHCKQILKNLLDLGRIEEMDLMKLDLREPLRSALKSIQSQCLKRNIKLDVEGFKNSVPVRGDASLLHEAIASMLQNAVEATAPGGRILIRLNPEEKNHWWPRNPSHQKFHTLTIQDNGKGINPKDLQRIFQPFFTTKGQGTGLGLSAALRILKKHGGSIEAYSEGAGKGAQLKLTIPLPHQGDGHHFIRRGQAG
ncbi:MAG: hypothetical protein HY400_02945 [Elusimicrobia bacterium]|nr:hypothetical protein [Elusimicrobiota bacterium]